MSYFVTKSGREIKFKDIASAIDNLHPELAGNHIFAQLTALGLVETFREGNTPFGLPYSFTEYRE